MGNLAGKGRMQENTSFPGDRWKDRVMLFSASIPSHSSGSLFAFILSSNIFDYFGFLIRHAILSIEHVVENLKKRDFKRSGQEGKSAVPASGFAVDFSMGKTALRENMRFANGF
ncbi:MAG: hypothetical protein LUE13_04005 [Akkermansiaceae bacterium]|nr:hypothetical protein [Akkermansiaceae bacterium]